MSIMRTAALKVDISEMKDKPKIKSVDKNSAFNKSLFGPGAKRSLSVDRSPPLFVSPSILIKFEYSHLSLNFTQVSHIFRNF
jgi:hypothetical protein